MSRYRLRVKVQGEWVGIGELESLDVSKMAIDMALARTDKTSQLPVFEDAEVLDGSTVVYHPTRPDALAGRGDHLAEALTGAFGQCGSEAWYGSCNSARGATAAREDRQR